MKNTLFALALLFGLTSIGMATSPSSYYGTVIDTSGHTVSNAVIKVYTAGSCATSCAPTTIYSDFGLTQVINQTTNPIVSAADGTYVFFVDAAMNGNVDLAVTARGATIVKSHFSMPGGTGGGGGGGGGFGTVVSSSIQSTLTTVQNLNAGAPVVVPQGFGGSGNFTNGPSPLPILNYTPSPSGDYDKNGVLPVDVFGVRHDGQAINCNIVSGNTQVGCFGSPTPHFTSADVGKLVLLYNAGPSASTHGGMVNGTVTASGGSGGTPGVQALVSTNGSCAYPFRGWVTVNNSGSITGGSAVTGWQEGYGCTSPPTTATVSTVTGTVTLTGLAFINVDLPTTIVSVQNSSTFTVADTPSNSTGGISILYGTDDYLALTAACNGHNLPQNGGHYTHVGISMISQGILCDGNNTWIEGAGWAPLANSGGGSAIVYAGKNVSGTDGIWITSQGWGAKLTDMGLKGNTWARPRGLVISQGHTPHGNGNSSNGIYERLWIGWMWGDGVGIEPAQLGKGIFADVSTGNGDFNNFKDIHINGVVHGIDGNNDQATEWTFDGNLEMESDYTGICAFSGMKINSFYTEFNDTDIQLGPCTSGSGITSLDIKDYGGESSAKNIVHGANLGAQDNSPFITIHSGGIGQPPQYEDPSNVMIDLGSVINTGAIILGDGYTLGGGGFTFGTTAGGERKALLQMPTTYGGTFQPYLSFNGINATQLSSYSFGSDNCGTVCNNRLGIKFVLNGNVTYADPFEYSGGVPTPWQQTDILGWQRTFGSTLIKSARPLGQTDLVVGAPYYGVSVGVVGTPGAKTYNYQMTCSDQAGNETAPPPTATGGTTPTTIVVSNGPTTLSTSNFIQISTLWEMRGCAYYNLYGDNGIGGTIGYLATISSAQFEFNNNGIVFQDQGQYTKTTRVPPVITQSGALTVEGPTTISNTATVAVGPLFTNQGIFSITENTSGTYSGDAFSENILSTGTGSFTGNFENFKLNGNTVYKIQNDGSSVQNGSFNFQPVNGIASGSAGYRQINIGNLLGTYSFYPSTFWTAQTAPVHFIWEDSSNATTFGIQLSMIGNTTVGSTNYGKSEFDVRYYNNDTNTSHNLGSGAVSFSTFTEQNGANAGVGYALAQRGDTTHTGWGGFGNTFEFDSLNFGVDVGAPQSSGEFRGISDVCGNNQTNQTNCTVGMLIYGSNSGTLWHRGLEITAAIDMAIGIPNAQPLSAYKAGSSGDASSNYYPLIQLNSSNLPIIGPTGNNVSGQAACFKSDGSLGHCTSVVSAGGACTCS